MNIVAEGIDYSRGGPLTSWQLRAAGKSFVGRYAVNDTSPNGRGITAAEYAELTAGGIAVFLYWESSEGWMTGGYAEGVQAAINAQNNINRAGMPYGTPVYFACDFDADENHQAAIDDCLRGCAEVLGPERVGLYAGYWPLLRAKQNGTARWFCQTLAWSGGRLLDGVHLYQFDTSGNYIAGVDVDLVRAHQEHFGQATVIATPPAYPAPILPDWYQRADKRVSPSSAEWLGNRWFPQRMNVEAITRTYVYTEPDIKSPHAGDPIEADQKVAIRWSFEDVATGRQWHVNDDGYVVASKFKQLVPLPDRRRAA